MAASGEMQFEKAIEYRDLLNSVKQIAQKQKITHNDGEDKDIIALAADDRDAVVQVFFIRDGKLIGRDHFYVKIGNEDTKEQILTTFVKQFYSGTPFIPREIMLPEEIDDHEVLAEWLGEKRGGKVYIRIPQKGMKEKLVELAQKNAELVLSQDKEKIKREEGRTIGAMKEIAGWLDLPGLQRVEAFDISNINGFETVGSMVVYEKGKPKRSDFASALDVGLTWDKATDTAAIDTGSHYKPDATQLITGNWAPATRARIQAVIDENANQGKYVVFDFDNTSVIFDIQEALLIYQIENLQFKIDPADMEAVLETGIPDLNKSMGTSLDGKNITPATLVADITSDYEWIYANYEGFEGDKDLNYIHASNQYQDFAAKLRFMYGNLGDYFDHAVSYPWVGYLFTGMTPDEVQELAAASHQYWADYGRYAEETWTSPVELPGKTGIVSIDFITGLTFTDELKDLYATLQANGIEVYIVSASPIDTVLAANETMGYNLPEDHVYAMRNKLGEDGRYINEYNYDWGGEGKYAQTQGEGKSTIITNFIAPQYDNAGPLMVFGDSSGDWNMMTDWMESGDTELGVIFNRYRKPGSDPIWQGSNEAAQSIGDPDARFVLQGRDENTGELRPSEKSILLGETDEVLVRPAE